jgi:hypothetical protein
VRFSLKQSRGNGDPYQRPLSVGKVAGWAGSGSPFSDLG